MFFIVFINLRKIEEILPCLENMKVSYFSLFATAKTGISENLLYSKITSAQLDKHIM